MRLFGKTDKSGSWPGYDLSGTGPAIGSLQTPAFVARTMRAISTDRPDHVISTHVNFGPAAQLAKRFFGTRYTLIAHGIDVHPALSSRSLAALREADRIIAVSEWTRSRVLDLGGIEPKNIVIVPNTIDETRFTVGPKPEALKQRYNIRDDEKVLLTVARLDPRERYKGYDRIIEALPDIENRVGPVRFLIVGSGGDQARVAELAREHGVEAMVTFAGFVPADSASRSLSPGRRVCDAEYR